MPSTLRLVPRPRSTGRPLGQQGTNRPREAAIRRRIMECRYKPVESLSPEAKACMIVVAT